MPPIHLILLGLALLFLIVHAVRSGFPLWPAVLMIIIDLLVAGKK